MNPLLYICILVVQIVELKTDYYETLQISKTASADEIKSAYRKLARKFHPDVSREPNAQKKFVEVQEAYDVLSDSEKRKIYDQFGEFPLKSFRYRPPPRKESVYEPQVSYIKNDYSPKSSVVDEEEFKFTRKKAPSFFLNNAFRLAGLITPAIPFLHLQKWPWKVAEEYLRLGHFQLDALGISYSTAALLFIGGLTAKEPQEDPSAIGSLKSGMRTGIKTMGCLAIAGFVGVTYIHLKRMGL